MEILLHTHTQTLVVKSIHTHTQTLVVKKKRSQWFYLENGNDWDLSFLLKNVI